MAPNLDPSALFYEDFNAEDLDIRPVSDPSTVTKAQQLAKAQFTLSLIATGQVNPKVAVERALQAAGEEGIEELMAMPQPAPDPVQLQMVALEAEDKEASALQKRSAAELNTAKAAQIAHESTGAQADAKLAETHASATLKHAQAMATAASAVPEEQEETEDAA